MCVCVGGGGGGGGGMADIPDIFGVWLENRISLDACSRQNAEYRRPLPLDVGYTLTHMKISNTREYLANTWRLYNVASTSM